MTQAETKAGSPFELGAIVTPSGVNFALYSKYADAVSLLIFKGRNDALPALEIELNPKFNRSGDIWHILLKGYGAGTFYGYKVAGPSNEKAGHRFQPHKILLDPYARAVADLTGVPKGVVTEDKFDWQGVERPRIQLADTVIYETHLRGLTVHSSSEVQHPGTFRGVIDKIDYLKELGVTAVELLPLQEFNHDEGSRRNPLTGEKLRNYWGYSTIAFFAPKASYCSAGDCGQQVVEFQEMVRELHRAGIEVILDIVFNHTAEMNHRGPVYNFRGIDNRAYYLLQPDRRYYQNLTGCGNTFFCNHAAAAQLIVDCLKYWHIVMRVDGFRFDLATIFLRNRQGNWWESAPLAEWIAQEPLLSEVKLIAEPWDAAGGYAVGRFGNRRWCDWNDRFRDEVRCYWRGDQHLVGRLATRISGSQDLFQGKNSPLNSVNFITCHDGFTLRDLVSFNRKHNLANGEGNRDGANQNYSKNFGVEGETDNPRVKNLRLRQAKNFFATLLLSQGVPMILGGDEFFRTQNGNNNAYCQDNELSWYDWRLLKANAELHSFVKRMIAFRRSFPSLRRQRFFAGGRAKVDLPPDVMWYSSSGLPRRWEEREDALICHISGDRRNTGAKKDCCDLYLVFNPARRKIKCSIPLMIRNRIWRLVLDTSAESPNEISHYNSGIPIAANGKFQVSPLSITALAAQSR